MFDYKRHNGQYIGAFAPYGYVKHPKDKHQLMVDPEASETVRLIFSMCLHGKAKHAITLHLNEPRRSQPCNLQAAKGIPHPTLSDNNNPMWSAGVVERILTNPNTNLEHLMWECTHRNSLELLTLSCSYMIAKEKKT